MNKKDLNNFFICLMLTGSCFLLEVYLKMEKVASYEGCSFKENKDCDLDNHFLSLIVQEEINNYKQQYNKKSGLLSYCKDIEINKKRTIASLNSCGNLSELFFDSTGYEQPHYTPKRKIKIAVIDTGIDTTNPMFQKNILIPNEFKNISDFMGINLVNKDFFPKDYDGHGSHIAGIILSIAPTAEILPINYYHKKDNTYHNNAINMAKAIILAVKANVDIINISGGGEAYIFEEEEAIKLARKKGIIVVAAAGNDQKQLQFFQQYYPASLNLDNVISVMSNDRDNKKSYFSNYGNDHISARGENVLSNSGKEGICFTSMSGTSQSTAIVSGALAAVMASSSKKLNYLDAKKQLLTYTDYEQVNNLEKENQHSTNILNMSKLKKGVSND